MTGVDMRPALDIDCARTAQVHDTLLGGYHSTAADREVVARLLAVESDAARWVQASHAFVCRATRFLLQAGVRQVLDIGAGIPAMGAHELAAVPDARVVYVDNDPVSVECTKLVLDGAANAVVIAGDVRDPESTIRHPQVTAVLDWSEPVGIRLGAVLQFVSDDPHPIVTRLREAAVPGSFLVISHATPASTETAQAVERIYTTQVAPLTPRSREQVESLFTGWRLIPPGVVGVAHWRREPGTFDDPAFGAAAARIPAVGGVGILLDPRAGTPR